MKRINAFLSWLFSASRYLGLLSTLLLYPGPSSNNNRVNNFVVEGFVPPHPDSDLAETWEPIHAKRRRLKHSYNYNPSFIHPELCRYMSEAECQDVDESLQDHARIQRQLILEQQQQQEQKQRDQGLNAEFDDHIQDGDISSLLDRLEYPSESVSKSSSSTSTTTTKTEKSEAERGPSRPMIRRNPSRVGSNQPIEVLVLLMRFQDHKDRLLPNREAYSALWNEQIHHWFDLNSYGNYRFHATVTDWMDTDQTEQTYAAGVSGLRYGLQESIWPLLNQLNDDPKWDWSRFDRNGDGKLDAVVILHSGYPAEVGGKDCSLNERPSTDRIWSHAFASSETWTTLGIMGSMDYSNNLQEYQQLQSQLQTLMQEQQGQPGGAGAGSGGPSGGGPQPLRPYIHNNNYGPLEPIYSLHGYLIASGLSGTCGADVAKMGVMVHEYMHTLGLDDLYDYGNERSGKGIGIWDIMGYPYGPANDEDYPGHLSAYSKLSLGWLTPMEWSPDRGTMALSLAPSEISSQAIKISMTNGTRIFDIGQPAATMLGGPSPSNKLMPQYQKYDGMYEEYLLLEHRQNLEYDRDLNDRTGLVIYHVDESVPRMNNRGYPGQDGWPQNGKHYRVAVLSADSLYDLERGINKGDSGDVWRPGSILGPGSNKRDNLRGGNRNSAKTYPNTDTYQYGSVKETNIFVQPLAQTKDFVTIRLSWRDISSGNTLLSEIGRQSENAAPESSWVRTERCINLWSWVDLEFEDGVKTKVHCDDVAGDPKFYCGLRDVSCDLKVSAICINECPGSDCNV